MALMRITTHNRASFVLVMVGNIGYLLSEYCAFYIKRRIAFRICSRLPRFKRGMSVSWAGGQKARPLKKCFMWGNSLSAPAAPDREGRDACCVGSSLSVSIRAGVDIAIR